MVGHSSVVSEEGLIAAERHSHLSEEGVALFIRTGAGHDGDVHTPDGIDLVEGNFREDEATRSEFMNN